MYANVRVSLADHEDVFAHEVRIEDGELVVCEDLCDGGNRPEPGAVHRHPLADLTGHVRITASF